MKNPKSLGMIIGAVLLLGACQKQNAEMSFRELDPNFGGLQGGKTVRVLGKNLRLDIGYSVHFGQQASPQVAIQSQKALTAVTPRVRTPGFVDVTVRADSGEVFRIKQGFEYINQAGNLLDQPADP